MKCLRSLLLVLLLVLAAQVANAAEEVAAPRRVHFVHTGALNGAIAPPDGPGGWSYVAGYARSLAAEGNIVFLFDCGDALWGSGPALVSGGEVPVRLANATGYDALLFGNLDVNAKALRELTVPLLAGNSDFYAAYGVRDLAVDTALINKGSVRIGVIAALYGPPASDHPYATHQALVAGLRQQGAELIVLLAHDAVGRDWAAYAKMGVDVVLAHWSQYAPPPQRELEAATGMEFSYTVGVRKGRNFGHLVVEIDGSGKVKTLGDREFLFSDTVCVPDTSVRELADQETGRVEETLNREVGRATTDFPHRLGSSSPAGELVLEAIHWRLNPEVVVYNSPGVRAGLTRGPIRYADLVNMLPFGNRVVTIELSGTQLRDLYARRNPNMLIRGLTAVPGTNQLMVNREALDDTAFYRVATNDYLVDQGSSPFGALKNGRNRIYGEGLVDLLAAYIRAQGEIAVPGAGGNR